MNKAIASVDSWKGCWAGAPSGEALYFRRYVSSLEVGGWDFEFRFCESPKNNNCRNGVFNNSLSIQNS